MSSVWVATGELKPRSAPTAMGKNARYAAMTATDIQRSHSKEPI